MTTMSSTCNQQLGRKTSKERKANQAPIVLKVTKLLFPTDASSRSWQADLGTVANLGCDLQVRRANLASDLQIEGEEVEAMPDFIFLGSTITVDGDRSHKIKRPCSLEEKLWQTQTVYFKAETLLRQQRSVQSKLWFFQQLFMNVRLGP